MLEEFHYHVNQDNTSSRLEFARPRSGIGSVQLFVHRVRLELSLLGLFQHTAVTTPPPTRQDQSCYQRIKMPHLSAWRGTTKLGLRDVGYDSKKVTSCFSLKNWALLGRMSGVITTYKGLLKSRGKLE